MTTTTLPTPGTKAWHDRVTADLRKRFGSDAQLTTASAEFKADAADPLLFTARITKDVLDRDNEVLLPGGMDASEFDQSGAVFWNHDYDRPVAAPIGKIQKTGDELRSRARFMKRVEGDNGSFLPDYARSFVTAMSEAGRSAGISIGFKALETRRPTKKDREVYGPDITLVIIRWKLLEWSIAPVQANQDAYVLTVGKSINKAACKSLFGFTPRIVEAEETPENKPEPTVDLSRVKMLVDLRRNVRAEAKRRRAERDAERKKAEVKRAIELKMLPRLAMAKARGELYVGQYDK